MSEFERIVEVVREMYGMYGHDERCAQMDCGTCRVPKKQCIAHPTCHRSIAAYLIEQDEKAGAKCQKS